MKEISWRRIIYGATLTSLAFLAAFGLLYFITPATFGANAPAWFQAIGSIFAVFIAMAVPTAQHLMSEEAKQREIADRARSLGLFLLPHINSFSSQNNKIWSHEHPDHHVHDLSDNSCIASSETMKALDVPVEIISCIEKLHELGPAAHGLQCAVFNVVAARELVTKQVVPSRPNSGFIYNLPTNVIFDKAQFYDLMWGASKGLTDSQNRIEALFAKENRPASD